MCIAGQLKMVNISLTCKTWIKIMTSHPKTGSVLALLLVGYNRPESIWNRIRELGDFTPHKLIISIDEGCHHEVR